jgi:hypothetical protein
MSRATRRSFSAAAAFLLVSALVGCTSTSRAGEPAAKSGIPLRISWRDYRGGQLLELVNESHTDRLEQYSKLRESAGRKVQTDDVMAAMVDHMQTGGYAKLWLPGSAPAAGAGAWFWSLEVEGPKGVSFIAEGANTPVEDKRPRRELRDAFIELYNNTYSLQAVKVKEGETPFSAPEPGKRPNN